jgi:PadR family transcriptional regulator, regulatory protein PadR
MIMPPQLLRGLLKTIVLKTVSDGDHMYGYDIIKTVKQQTGGRVQITEGALYPMLHALEAGGLLQAETAYSGRRIRKYYSISKTGQLLLAEKLSEIKGFVAILRILFPEDITNN